MLALCYIMICQYIHGCHVVKNIYSQAHFLLLGTRSQLVPTHRPWPLPHPWVHSHVITNRPEITAETVKPTPTVSGSSGNCRLTICSPNQRHHVQQNHQVDSRTQTRDQLFLSRLRNRYRQVSYA